MDRVQTRESVGMVDWGSFVLRRPLRITVDKKGGEGKA